MSNETADVPPFSVSPGAPFPHVPSSSLLPSSSVSFEGEEAVVLFTLEEELKNAKTEISRLVLALETAELAASNKEKDVCAWMKSRHDEIEEWKKDREERDALLNREKENHNQTSAILDAKKKALAH